MVVLRITSKLSQEQKTALRQISACCYIIVRRLAVYQQRETSLQHIHFFYITRQQVQRIRARQQVQRIRA